MSMGASEGASEWMHDCIGVRECSKWVSELCKYKQIRERMSKWTSARWFHSQPTRQFCDTCLWKSALKKIYWCSKCLYYERTTMRKHLKRMTVSRYDEYWKGFVLNNLHDLKHHLFSFRQNVTLSNYRTRRVTQRGTLKTGNGAGKKTQCIGNKLKVQFV